MEDDKRKAKVTDEHKEEARLLRALWDSRAVKLNQADFGKAYQIGNQSAVGQFLRGDVPLSLKAAKGFAFGMGCDIAAFSPRLAKVAAEAGAHAGTVREPATPYDLTSLNKMEMQLVMLFRGLSIDDQAKLLSHANTLYIKHNPGKSAANPFHGVPAPGTQPEKSK